MIIGKPPILIDFSLQISKTSNTDAHNTTLEPHAYIKCRMLDNDSSRLHMYWINVSMAANYRNTHIKIRAVRTHALASIYRVHCSHRIPM